MMARFLLRELRLLGPLGVVTTLGLSALPAFAQEEPSMTDCANIRFELANPAAGDRINPGRLVVQGIAADPRADNGTGIDRIDFFLDSRDEGGMKLGSTVPGVVAGPFGPESFEATVSVPKIVGGHNLFGYAHSGVTGQESIVSVPVAVGEDPSKAGDIIRSGMTMTCTMETGFAAPGAPPLEVAGAQVLAQEEPAAPVTSIDLQIGNPEPGATIHVGGYMIEGTAVDNEAGEGKGIDSIDVFLESRDDGGILLGSASADSGDDLWHLMVNIPARQRGPHNLYFYAHSSVSGGEAVVSIPVTVTP
jgi:hypothetical protein